jgi:DNA-binding NarL/FixJ family response regulator
VSHPKLTRIFIAEDSEFLRDILMRSLSAMDGVHVAGHARSGEAAIIGVREASPDIVLLDLAMPAGSGFTVLEALKPAVERPFIVVLTMHTQAAFRDQCQQLGAHVFLDKASEIQRLLDALHELAGRDFDLPQLLDAFSHHPKPTK